MTLTLVCDHRILYGADAAQFLARIRELLETPSALTPSERMPTSSPSAGEVRLAVRRRIAGRELGQ